MGARHAPSQLKNIMSASVSNLMPLKRIKRTIQNIQSEPASLMGVGWQECQERID
jgi:hypothetical protein